MPAGLTYEPIQTYTLSSATNIVEFSSISGAYKDLRLVTVTRGTTTAYIAPAIRFNTDTTTTNYSWTAVFGDGTSTYSYRVTNQDVISGEQVPRSSDSAGLFGVVSFEILNYANSTTQKSVLVRNSSIGANGIAYAGVGLWRATPQAITKIIVKSGTPNFEVGSTFTLYGIAAA